MELKFRRKGEVVRVDGFPSTSIPAPLRPPEGLEGIDLTAYSVIFARFGRRGPEKARELHSRVPHVILVYKDEWRCGWGEGILLPDRFDPGRVRFYKSAAQEKTEAGKAEKRAAEALCEEVAQAIPGVRVGVARDRNGVEISPLQETFAAEGWGVRAQSLEEALAGVEKLLPLWKEWNDRALEAYARRGFPKPGNGEIQLIFRQARPPLRPERVGISFDVEDDRGRYQKAWIVLEKKEGEWVEWGDLTGPEADPLNLNANL